MNLKYKYLDVHYETNHSALHKIIHKYTHVFVVRFDVAENSAQTLGVNIEPDAKPIYYIVFLKYNR